MNVYKVLEEERKCRRLVSAAPVSVTVLNRQNLLDGKGIPHSEVFDMHVCPAGSAMDGANSFLCGVGSQLYQLLCGTVK